MAFLRENDIVPVTSPGSTKKVEPCHFFFADFDPGLIFVFINLKAREPSLGRVSESQNLKSPWKQGLLTCKILVPII